MKGESQFLLAFFYLKIHETILEIKYAAPLAVNGMMSCDLGFCPKLE